jgi:dihydroorotate dehydrogenase electron transfer subunit
MDCFVQTTARVLEQRAVSTRYHLLRLHCPAVAQRAQPGQFVMVACTPDGDAPPQPLLPRPLAILDASGETLELLYFVAGAGTAALHRSAQNPGAALRLIGPLGVGFTPIPDVDEHIALGGGSGVAPLVFFFRRCAQPHWKLILAARGAAQLPNAESVAVNAEMLQATDDGSAGFKGTAVDALKSLLIALPHRRVGIYAAGPEPMMRAAAEVAKTHSLPARVTLEARMACGVGVCRACVVDGLSPHPKTGLARRTVCHDGPVFDPAHLAGW